MKSIVLTTLLTGIIAITAFVPESDDFNASSTVSTSISASTSGEVLIAQTNVPGERRRVRRRTRRRVNRRHERRENKFYNPMIFIWG